MEKEIRGLDLRADNFRTQLMVVINESNLPISLIMYIMKDMLNEITDLYIQTAAKQYEEFCIAAQKEQEEQDNAIKENAEQE